MAKTWGKQRWVRGESVPFRRQLGKAGWWFYRLRKLSNLKKKKKCSQQVKMAVLEFEISAFPKWLLRTYSTHSPGQPPRSCIKLAISLGCFDMGGPSTLGRLSLPGLANSFLEIVRLAFQMQTISYANQAVQRRLPITPFTGFHRTAPLQATIPSTDHSRARYRTTRVTQTCLLCLTHSFSRKP